MTAKRSAFIFEQKSIMKNSITKSFCLVSYFLFSIPFLTKAQEPPQDLSNALQSILDDALPVGISNSGVVMSVYVPGQWSWSGSSGYAVSGMTTGTPESMATPYTKFRVGSITKTFVATCIMLLEEEGTLSTEDAIDNYLRPSLINDTIMSSTPVKIRHLLNHTSGIANSAENMSCQEDVLNNPLSYYSYEDAVYCGASQGEMYPPEFAWGYSNTNYTLLAMIIEEVSGLSYADYVNMHIIEPLGLENTEVPIQPEISGDYMGCYWNIGSWIDLSIIHPSIYRGWADIVSTTHDINSFFYNLLEGNIVNNTSLNKMKSIDPASFDYGFGLDFYVLGNHSYYGHSGEVANSSSMFYSELNSEVAPEGYYISYNFSVQGVNMPDLIDIPVYDLLNQNLSTETQIKKNSKVIFYPNPADTQVALNGSHNRVKYKLIDTNGKVVMSSVISSNESIDVSNIPNGNYIFSINTDNGIEQHQLIIHHN